MVKPIKIIFVTYEYPPLGGGVATEAKKFVEEFPKYQDFKFDIVTSSLSNEWKSKQVSHNCNLHFVPIGKKSQNNLHFQTPLNMLMFTVNSSRIIHSLTSNHQYHMCHYFGYPGAWPGLLFQKKMPYMISLRGVDVPGYNQKYGLYYHLYRPITLLSWGKAKSIVANSGWLKQMALKTAPKLSIKVIPNGVDSDLFKPMNENDKFKKFTITAGGTLMNPKKNHKLLIDAFAQFHHAYPDSQLLLFGSGPLENALKSQINNLGITSSVIFKGRVNQVELSRELPKCHIFCLLSKAEGMSNAALEALACGLPLVMTDVGAAPEMIIDNGVIVSDRLKDIVTAFERIHTNSNRIKMGNASRKMSLKYSWKHTVEQYIKLYCLGSN